MDTKTTARTGLVVALKLAACGATVAAVALAIVTLSPDGEVPTTQADVLDFSFGPKNRTEVFTDVLGRMGHGDPEPYNLNGNVLYFSSQFTKGSPLEIFEDYQRTLVDQGYNRKAYGAPDPGVEAQMELTEGLLLGDLIPVLVEKDHVIMAGGTIKNEARTRKELEQVGAIPDTPGGWAGLFKGHKWVEITRHEEYDDSSLVISSWGDDFNIKKMIPNNQEEDQNVAVDVPACPGCTRILQFDDLGSSKLHQHTGYADAPSVDAAVQFYINAMTRRGWELTETSAMYQKVRDRVEFVGDDATQLQFTKNDEFLTILAYPEDGGATVQVVRSD